MSVEIHLFAVAILLYICMSMETYPSPCWLIILLFPGVSRCFQVFLGIKDWFYGDQRDRPRSQTRLPDGWRIDVTQWRFNDQRGIPVGINRYLIKGDRVF